LPLALNKSMVVVENLTFICGLLSTLSTLRQVSRLNIKVKNARTQSTNKGLDSNLQEVLGQWLTTRFSH
jgi:hypothetical protein